MTTLTQEERKIQMEAMKAFDEQMPCVGIFWYDPQEKMLFGVREQEFSLPYFEYRYDYHWDLGHGWSGDMKELR